MGKGIVESLKDEYDFEIEAMAFEIHPETPQEGRHLKEAFPGYEQMVSQLKAFGKSHNVLFGEITHLYHTHKAMLIGELAKDQGVSNAFTDVMFKAYFVEGKDINDEAVLVELADQVNLTESDVLAALKNEQFEKRLNENMALGREYAINSVPTFIINDQYKVVGSQSREEIKKVFDKILNK